MSRRLALPALALLLCGAAVSAHGRGPLAESAPAPHEPWLDAVSETEAIGQVRDAKGQPLSGITVRLVLDGATRTLATDERGCFRFADPLPGTYRFEMEGEGFEPLKRTVHVAKGQKWPRLRFILRSVAGAVVEVASGMTVKVAPKLRSEIITTEALPALDIRKTNATSLVEAIDCKPGVSIQTECSICNVRNVVLNNLPGRFTTVMIDGVPIFSSVSSAYGLEMVGVNGIESIDISRGAGVSLIAPEALAGTVNLVPRRPEKPEATVETQGGDGGFRRLEGFWGRPVEGGALTASFTGIQHDSLDANGNLASEYTGFKRYLAGFGFFKDHAAGFKVRGRLDLVDERRGGGALGFDHDAIKRNMSGNPFDWSQGPGGSPDRRGWIRPDGDFDAARAEGQDPIRLADGRVLVPYRAGRGGFSELIDTKRQQVILNAERDLGDNRVLHLHFGAANHDQDSFYEGDYYKANQKQYFFEGSLQWFLGETLLTTGLNYRFEDLRSKGILKTGSAVDGLDNYAYKTPALYLQLYHAFLGGKLELNGSVRQDDNNVFGSITTPRVNLLWHHSDRINSRFALGRGFRLPTSFFEQDHGILSTTRIDREIDRPETSDNASYTFSAGGEHMALVVSASYNRIRNFALLDSGAKDSLTGAPITRFTQSHDPLVVKGLDGTFTAKLPGHVEATLGAEKYRYDFKPGTLSFSRPEERVYLRFDHDREDLSLFARATWTGTQNLRRFYDYAHTPRFNMDGTPKLDRSPAFWTVDASATWKLSKRASLVLSVNNLFDYQQTDREDFLWIDAAGGYDVTQVWGPGRGRSLQAGLRWSF